MLLESCPDFRTQRPQHTSESLNRSDVVSSILILQVWPVEVDHSELTIFALIDVRHSDLDDTAGNITKRVVRPMRANVGCKCDASYYFIRCHRNNTLWRCLLHYVQVIPAATSYLIQVC